MNSHFQQRLLMYLVQRYEASKYIHLVPKSVFAAPHLKFILGLAKDYYKDYSTPPTANVIQSLAEDVFKEQPVDPNLQTMIVDTVHLLYGDIGNEAEFTKGLLMKIVKQQIWDDAMENIIPETGMFTEEVYIALHNQLSKIIKMGQDDLNMQQGKFVFQDFSESVPVTMMGKPCIFKGINRLTNAGGFRSPELIVILADAKGFKTGVMLNVAYGYALSGLNILVVDTENGTQQVSGRLEQRAVKATFSEVVEPDLRQQLGVMLGQIKRERQSDIRVEYFIAGSETMQDVESRMEELKSKYGFEPDVIIWDYIDNLGCEDKNLKANYEKIRYNYKRAMAIQAKYGCFGFTASHINRKGADVKYYTKETLGDDYKKAANAHGCWAVHCTNEEKAAGVGRMYWVFQREGIDYISEDTIVYVKMMKERMYVEEVTKAEYLLCIETAGEAVMEGDSIAGERMDAAAVAKRLRQNIGNSME